MPSNKKKPPSLLAKDNVTLKGRVTTLPHYYPKRNEQIVPCKKIVQERKLHRKIDQSERDPDGYGGTMVGIERRQWNFLGLLKY